MSPKVRIAAPMPGLGVKAVGMAGRSDLPFLYQVSMIITHLTAVSCPLARSGWRRGVGHHKAPATRARGLETVAFGGADRPAGGPK